MIASFALNFILQLYFALVCLSLLCPFSPAAGLNFTPPCTAYSVRSLLGTPRVRGAASVGAMRHRRRSFGYRRVERRWDLHFMWAASALQRAKNAIVPLVLTIRRRLLARMTIRFVYPVPK